MKDVVIFHLKRIWEGKDLWEEIKQGRKTSEWREATSYWFKRLLIKGAEPMASPYEIDYHRRFWKVHKAWFVGGYPKANLPRLEAEITGLVYHPDSSQLEIKFTNVKEVTTFSEEYLKKRKQSVDEAIQQLKQKEPCSMEKYRKYHIIIEGDMETNMTAEEIKHEANGSVAHWSLDRQKVTVKPIVQKKRKETTR